MTTQADATPLVDWHDNQWVRDGRYCDREKRMLYLARRLEVALRLAQAALEDCDSLPFTISVRVKEALSAIRALESK